MWLLLRRSLHALVFNQSRTGDGAVPANASAQSVAVAWRRIASSSGSAEPSASWTEAVWLHAQPPVSPAYQQAVRDFSAEVRD